MTNKKRCLMCGDVMLSRAKYPYCRRSKQCKRARARYAYQTNEKVRATRIESSRRLYAANQEAIRAKRRERWMRMKVLKATLGS